MLQQLLSGTALLPLLVGLASGAQDGDDVHPWAATIPVPKTASFGVDFGYSSKWFDKGEVLPPTFEGEPQDLLEDAAARLDAGEVTARALHQLAFGLVRTGRFEEGHLRLLDGCFQRYAAEVEADAEDFELRVDFASALSLGAMLLRSRELLDGCLEQYEGALELEPGDGRVWSRMSMDCFGFYLRTREVEEDASLLDQALEYAEAAVEAAPEELGPRVRLADLQVGIVAARPPEDAVSAMADAMEALADGARGSEGGEQVAVCAEVCWCWYRTMPLLMQATPGEGAAPAGPEAVPEAVEARLDGALEGLSRVEDEDLRTACARVLWVAHLLAGDEADDEARLERVQGHGLAENEACRLGITLSWLLGRSGERFAEALPEVASVDEDWAALASHLRRSGEDAAALDALGELEAPTIAHDVAAGILELRLGRTEAGLARLEELAERLEEAEEVEGVAGPLLHAHGVALALAGRHAEALVQLEAAADAMDDAEPLEEVLEAVRAALDGDQQPANPGRVAAA